MVIIREERERLRHQLHTEIVLGKKTLAEALAVECDPQHRIRQQLLLWFSNFGLMIAGSKFRARIIK